MMLGIFTMVRSKLNGIVFRSYSKNFETTKWISKADILEETAFCARFVQNTHVYEKWEKLKREHTRGNDFHKKIGLDQNTTEHNKTLARTQTQTHIKMAQDINKYTASSNALNDSDLRIYMHYNTWTM